MTDKYQRQIERILQKWAAQPAPVGDFSKQNRWPAGAPGSKGGQFAPTQGGGYGGKYPGGGKPMKGEGSGAAQFSSYGSLFGAGSTFPGGQSPKWAGEEAGLDAPKGPPPGAKPHLKPNDKGETVTVNYPTKPSDKGSWTDPNRTATFVPGGETPAVLNGVAMKPWASVPKSDSEWAAVPGQKLSIDARHPFEPTPGKSTGAGVIIREPDGRVWLTKPTNAFGGYQQTFPKGTVEHGLSMQASAIKETWEETGLQIKITGILGDYERTTSKARFYIAERVGGTPADMGWESQAVRLATRDDMAKLLNMGVDKGILADLEDEGFFRKSAPPKKGGGHWEKQARWPQGTPLGGQWKMMDGDGVTMPPTIAGGLTGSNSAYQKKANAAYAAAKAGDKKTVLDTAIVLAAKVKENEAKGASSSHVKWNAQLSQFVTQLASDIFAAVKASAIAERLMGLMGLSSLTYVKAKSEGSNPGAHYTDAKGNEWLVKGNAAASSTGPKVSDDRARNEVLASKLMLAAGAGAPEMRLVDLEGKHGGAKGEPGNLGVASKIVAGVTKADLSNPAHIAAMQKDFAVHAWLGNWDVLGAGMDNTMIGADGKAVCIDPGGSIFFRAQGSAKAKGAFGKDAADFETMRKTDHLQQKVFGSMTASQLADSASKLASVTDDAIRELVKTHGPAGEAAQKELADILIARRDAILAKAGVQKGETLTGAKEAPATAVSAPVAEPPSAKAALTPTTPVAGLNKPDYDDTFQQKDYYDKLTDKMLEAHAAGDMATLKALALNGKGLPVGTKPSGSLSINGKLLKPFHAALVADLAKQQGAAQDALAAGKATLTDTTGKTWVADDKGVLQPTAAQGAKALTGEDLNTLYDAYAAGISGKGVNIANDDLANAALAGDLGKLQAVAVPKSLQPYKAALIAAMGGTPGVLKPGQKATQASIPMPTGANMLKPVGLTGMGAIVTQQIADNLAAGNIKQLENIVANATAMTFTGKTKVKAYAEAALAEAKEAASAKPQVFTANKDAKLTTSKLDEILDQNGYVPHDQIKENVKLKSMVAAALEGDMDGLKAIKPDEVSQANLKDDLLGQMKEQADLAIVMAAYAGKDINAPDKPAREAKAVIDTPQPVPQPAPKVPTGAAPDFAKAMLTSGQNAPSHNAKINKIKALFEAGDEKGILALKLGTNTYAPKQVKVANDALAALGSVHQVTKGQAANSHPALTGGTVQAAPAALKPANAAPAKPHVKPFDPGKISTPPDFKTMGTGGGGLSSVPAINEANNAAVKAIYEAASKGDLEALKALTYPEVDKGTGNPTGNQIPFASGTHPSKHVSAYFQNLVNEVDLQLNPPVVAPLGARVAAHDWDGGFSQLKPVAAGKAISSVAKTNKAGDYIILGTVKNVLTSSLPKENNAIVASSAWKDAAKKAYKAAPQKGKDTFGLYVSTSGAKALNTALRKGELTETVMGRTVKQHMQDFKDLLVDIPEGSTFTRNMGMKGHGQTPEEMKVKEVQQFLLGAERGTVVQEPGFSSSSWGMEILSGNDIQWRFTAGKGVKAYPAWLTTNAGEGESLFPPQQRYMILGAKKVGKTVVVDAILLPTID